MLQMERLELSRRFVSPLEPKSSAFTQNYTTPVGIYNLSDILLFSLKIFF